ncbi:amidohydrolase, partial [Escherichia coli]|nr:amidohydrolase [Escherichia coli]
FNVIADSAKLVGTVRTFSEDVRNDMEREIERVIQGTCLAADASYDYSFKRGYPAVVNHSEENAFLAKVAETIPEVEKVEETEPQMGGEDFAYYLQHIKG